MKRLLTTAATALVLSTGAYAQDAGQATSYEFNAEQDFYASNLIGMRVYRAEQEFENEAKINADATQEWDDIGEVNDLIVNTNGEVEVAIIGVGGFLGIGEKDVAINMDSIKVLHEDGDSGERFLVVNIAPEELESAPEVDREGRRTLAATNPEKGPMSEEVAANADTQAQAEGDAAKTDLTAQVDADANAEANADANADANAGTMATAETNAEVDATAEAATTEMAEGEAKADAETTEMAEAGTERTPLERPQMQLEGYNEVTDFTKISTDTLVGERVYGTNDEDVGEIGNLILTDSGEVEHAIIDVGGFLGIGEKEIAVSFEELQVLNDENGNVRVYINATEEELEQQPEYDG
jgi:sporulation protein YlmC with PRC-barrel domain